jgi:hypothetical protein
MALHRALSGQLRSARKDHHTMLERSVDFKYIARVLHIRVELVRRIVVDLQLLPQDEPDKVPLPALREFMMNPAKLILFAGWKLARPRQKLGLDNQQRRNTERREKIG